jgi:hypothetical protein
MASLRAVPVLATCLVIAVVALSLLVLAEAVTVPHEGKTHSNSRERRDFGSERADNHSHVPAQDRPSTPELPAVTGKSAALVGDPGATTCPPWFLPQNKSEGNATCVCGSSLNGVVRCNSTTQQAYLHQCYCMSYGEDRSLVVGKCLYSCYHRTELSSPYYQLPSNISELLNHVDCRKYNREGQLCGKCKEGFAPSVNSYGLNCVKCKHSGLNWLKYIAVTFLPLTVFFAIVIVFRVKVTSPSVYIFVFVCQIQSLPSYWHITGVQPQNYVISTLISIYGIWNLDFFRPLIPPFCLVPNMSTPQAIAMDYLAAAYPLTLILVVYAFVELYDRDFWVVRQLWQPFHKCCTYFRQEWEVKTSLIDVFVTFFLLSYNKFLRVSYDLLVPVYLQDIHGETQQKSYLYLDGTMRYFGDEHLPYAILAIAVMSCVIVMPCLLLCLYPSRWVQKCLSRYRGRRLVQLNAFMEAFYGHYKDGTNGTRDCRYFAAVYLIMRFAILTTAATTLTSMYYPIAATLYMICALSIYVTQPYKSTSSTVISTFLVSTLAFTDLWVIVYYDLAYTENLLTSTKVMISISMLIPLIFGIMLLLRKLFGQRPKVLKILKKFQFCQTLDSAADSEESLPYRLVHNEESTTLLSPLQQIEQQYGSLTGENCNNTDTWS